jgi:hypothetical protein
MPLDALGDVAVERLEALHVDELVERLVTRVLDARVNFPAGHPGIIGWRFH